jgi:hypothetical protein
MDTFDEMNNDSIVVRDDNNFPVAYVYFASELGRTRFLMTRDEARTIAGTISKLPELLNGKGP